MPSSPAEGDSAPVIIKKYANRRLYDTESSSYITLEHLSAMTRKGREFKVVDAKSGDDITHSVLTQIIVGDQMQAMVPHYLEASMEAFRRNQEQVRTTMMGMMSGGSNPFEALARQNMAMMKAAADMWATGAVPTAAHAEPAPKGSAPDDVKALKDELRALQAKIDNLVKE